MNCGWLSHPFLHILFDHHAVLNYSLDFVLEINAPILFPVRL